MRSIRVVCHKNLFPKRKNRFIWNSEHDWKTLLATFRFLTVSLHLGHHDRGIVARNVEYPRVFSPFFRRGEDG